MSTVALAPHVPPISHRCEGLVTHLVLRCGRGDESALGELFDLTYFLVAGVVARGPHAGGLDVEVVEAFRRLWRRSPSYEPSERGVLAWVVDQVIDSRASVQRRQLAGMGVTS